MTDDGGPDPILEFLKHTHPGLPPEPEGHERRYFDAARASVLNYGAGVDIVEKLAFLRIVGTPDELEREYEELGKAFQVVDGIVRDRRRAGYLRVRFFSEVAYGEKMDAPDAHGVDLLEGIEQLGDYLYAAQEEAKRIVAALEDDGFVYEDGMLKVTGTGGRRRHVVSDLIGRVWEWVREPGDSMYSADVRDRVRGALSSVFPPEILTDDRIKSAIQNHQRR